MTRNFTACTIACWVLYGGAALAEDCKPLQLITSIPLTTEPSGRVTMPVSINGTTKEFLFDTGGTFPQLSKDVVDELKLPRGESRIQMYGASGERSDYYTTVQSFQFGTLRTKMDMPISPDPVNIFSPLVFPNYDFDLDLAANKLNILSSDHCEGKVIYWPAKALAVVPIVTGNYSVTVPVTLDGHDLNAIIDTGASDSLVRLDIAQYGFKIDPKSPDLKPVGNINGTEEAVLYSYPFKTLTFEGITVQNPQILVATDVVNKKADHTPETGSRIKTVSDDLKLPPVIIGMNILRKLHPYFAFKEKRLYMTEASTPPPAAPASGNPPKSQ